MQKSFISYAVIVFINLLFFYKYIDRLTHFTSAFTALYLILIIWFLKKQIFNKFFNNKTKYIAISFLLFLAVFIHYYVDIHNLNVDRWSVISSFFEQLEQAKYPYFAHSHLGNPPGPMPFYFFIAFPFYSTGFYVLLSVLGYLLFVWLIDFKLKSSYQIILLLLLSPFLYWEIVSRSNLFTYSFFVVITLLFFLNKYRPFLRYLVSFILGLLLATRSVYILVLIILYLSLLWQKKISFKELIYNGIFLTLGFALPFIPLIAWFPHKFFVLNPFMIQSGFLIPVYYIGFFIVIAVILSFFVKDNKDIFYYSGISLFLSILIYFFYHIFKVGFINAYINSIADISYFILSVPFLLEYLRLSKKRNV